MGRTMQDFKNALALGAKLGWLPRHVMDQLVSASTTPCSCQSKGREVRASQVSWFSLQAGRTCCNQCAAGSGALLKIHRLQEHEAVRAADLIAKYDTFGVQLYGSAPYRVALLRPPSKPMPHLVSNPRGSSKCVCCDQQLWEPCACFCSIKCKMQYEDEGVRHTPNNQQLHTLISCSSKPAATTAPSPTAPPAPSDHPTTVHKHTHSNQPASTLRPTPQPQSAPQQAELPKAGQALSQQRIKKRAMAVPPPKAPSFPIFLMQASADVRPRANTPQSSSEELKPMSEAGDSAMQPLDLTVSEDESSHNSDDHTTSPMRSTPPPAPAQQQQQLEDRQPDESTHAAVTVEVHNKPPAGKVLAQQPVQDGLAVAACEPHVRSRGSLRPKRQKSVQPPQPPPQQQQDKAAAAVGNAKPSKPQRVSRVPADWHERLTRYMRMKRQQQQQQQQQQQGDSPATAGGGDAGGVAQAVAPGLSYVNSLLPAAKRIKAVSPPRDTKTEAVAVGRKAAPKRAALE